MNPPSRLLHSGLVVLTVIVLSWAWSVLRPADPVPAVVTWLDLSAALVKADSHDGERPEVVAWPQDATPIRDAAAIVGRVIDADGVPVRDALVTVTDGAGRSNQAAVGVDGRFAFASVMPGDVTLEAFSLFAGRSTATRRAEPGERLRWDPVLERAGHLAGRVLDLRGGEIRPAAGLVLALTDDGGDVRHLTTDDAGRFAWTSPDDAPVALALVETAPHVASVGDLSAVAPGGDPVLVALVDTEPGQVAGEVSLDGRPPLRPVTVIARHVASGFTRRVESTGRFAVEDLPPGEIAVDVEVFGKTIHQGTSCDVAAGELVAVGELAVAPMGRLVLERAPDLLEDSTTIEIRGASGRPLAWHDLTPHERDAELALAPGTYTLVVSSRGRARWSQDVTVTPRVVTTSTLTVPLDDDRG